jgi:glutamyl-tRNA synthetase/glutamyl-Q tRNA(Asp) synthetase
MAISDEIMYFNDVILGKQVQHPAAQCGDILLRDKLGNWTYQFSVVVDDISDNVNLVIRGVDLLQSTGRQLLLNKKLDGSNLITYFHHPIIYDERGYKLSKRNHSTTIKELRKKGMSREAVINLALNLLSNKVTS